MSQSSGKLIIGGLGVWAGKNVWGEGTEVRRYRVSKVEGHAWGEAAPFLSSQSLQTPSQDDFFLNFPFSFPKFN